MTGFSTIGSAGTPAAITAAGTIILDEVSSVPFLNQMYAHAIASQAGQGGANGQTLHLSFSVASATIIVNNRMYAIALAIFDAPEFGGQRVAMPISSAALGMSSVFSPIRSVIDIFKGVFGLDRTALIRGYP
jgi:hypothetical protein